MVNEYISKKAREIAKIVEGLSDTEVGAVFNTFWRNHTSKPKANKDED